MGAHVRLVKYRGGVRPDDAADGHEEPMGGLISSEARDSGWCGDGPEGGSGHGHVLPQSSHDTVRASAVSEDGRRACDIGQGGVLRAERAEMVIPKMKPIITPTPAGIG